MDQEKIGSLIKEIRISNNLTQKNFAESLGVTFQAVSKWENGKNIPDIGIIKMISEKYKIDIQDILDGTLNMKSKKKKNLKYIVIIIFVLFILIAILFNGSKSFDFRYIKSENSLMEVRGVVAFSKNNSSIYISGIDLNLEDDSEYKILECILFERKGDQQYNISKCESVPTDSASFGEPLNNLLGKVQFKVDYSSKTCKNFEDSNLFLEINAVDKNSKITKYEVPIKMDKACSK